MSFENQLEQLGLILPNPAKPAGSYKPCLIVDNIAYISGQGPLLEDGSFAKGVIIHGIADVAENHERNKCNQEKNQKRLSQPP